MVASGIPSQIISIYPTDFSLGFSTYELDSALRLHVPTRRNWAIVQWAGHVGCCLLTRGQGDDGLVLARDNSVGVGSNRRRVTFADAEDNEAESEEEFVPLPRGKRAAAPVERRV